jgi:hypothetical protein
MGKSKALELGCSGSEYGFYSFVSLYVCINATSVREDGAC